MLMHVTAHGMGGGGGGGGGGCTDTVKESALKIDSGTKILAAPGTRTRVSIAPWLSSQTLYQLSYFHLYEKFLTNYYRTIVCVCVTEMMRKTLNEVLQCICHYNLWDFDLPLS